ncbi:MAG: 16S rRNA (uracil(1498)-N(3))-methyltransferase [Rickettsiales bacterium]|jgi:16S rRNA (uracil1498-N3)-methyltransferase|nr:16S rRNA (uracil(1498)-N(3))-methyltransferase [Rickettsiales bacterium]
MKNLPRIFINEQIEAGKSYLLTAAQSHYLTKVMRVGRCLIFNNGLEFSAELAGDSKYLVAGAQTGRRDPSNDMTFCFAPVKKIDEMLNMATQMGVGRMQPVITERTVARHANWGRIEKIIIEASEQSGRNSIPELAAPIIMDSWIKKQREKIVFADERLAHCDSHSANLPFRPSVLLIGPEGGFSPAEFAALDNAGAVGISLGKTILRAETAAVAALAKIL